VTIHPLFNDQVDALVKDIHQLEFGQGADQALFQKIRRQVSGELLNLGRLEICSAAIGELHDENSVTRFRAIINHCSQHFYLQDRVLSALALPLSVRMKTAIDDPFTLKDADADHLHALAEVSKNLSGASRFQFDNRLFAGRTLFYCNARKLFAHLRQLEAGIQQPNEGLLHGHISTGTDGWQVVYLLGVAVSDLQAPLRIDELQQVLGNWTHLAAWSVEQHKQVVFSKGVTVQADCHGFHYLDRAVEVGENALRGHQLQSLLANLNPGDKYIKFYYVHDLVNFQVKLVVVSSAMTVEHKCKLMGAETLDGFRRELAIAINTVLGSHHALGVQEVSLYDYTQLAHTHGLNLWGALP
jgi:hypothetical protein